MTSIFVYVKVSVVATKETSLPAIGQLFNSAWDVFKNNLLKIFLLNIVGLVAGAIVGLVFFVGILLAGLPAVFSGASQFSVASALIGLLVIVVAFVGFIIVTTAISIGNILIVGENNPQKSLKETIHQSIALILPLIAVNFIVLFLTLGGLFLFVIPGIVIAILLSFASYEVILDNKRSIAALKSSVSIISKNFGAIFIRVLILWGITWAVSILISSLSGSSDNPNLVISLFGFVINILIGWFGLAYMVTLYKQAKGITPSTEDGNMTWMWIVSTIGWIIGVLITIGLLATLPALFNNPEFRSAFDKQQQMQKQYGGQYDSSEMLELQNEMMQKYNEGATPEEIQKEMLEKMQQQIPQEN